MNIVKVNEHDISAISDIWERCHSHSFELPSRRNLITEAKILNDKDKIIGYGQVRLVAEPIMILDLETRLRDRIKALQLLMTEAYRGVELVGLKRIHAFIRDPYFADLIVKHFGWTRGDLGELLVKELEG